MIEGPFGKFSLSRRREMELSLGEKRKVSIREVNFEGLLEGNRESL